MAQRMGFEMSSYRVVSFSGQDPALEPYKAMIYSDFMKSLRYGNDWYALIDSKSYFSIYKRLIDEYFSNPHCVVKLACLTEDLDTCLGWSIAQNEKLHYCFVKKDQRGQGIGESLIPEHFSQVTHLTKIGQAIRKYKFPEVIFNPFN